ncbi:regulator of nonsense transcripts UPF3 isoform X1 [Rosa rugosa]|uniref:regulator of nonsense transcripts UPF3 isoform X1 n=1 Tax=Rosa rugosa TaxID=74645 RepID=UPI002B401307|nr:regulator of nonsense transcripts UPF3 isoform X1 [Rosa rugosa]XP_062028231.1 regulator of nonsense transcripts UPF3 isoform X1 [Rosa rugosa]XP_062028232.1 regulator of nonsense transcripts UPF3 isoform X1 [Rosa rugosa]
MKDPSVRTKVLVRHLPPSLSQSDFFQQIDHLFGDRHNWFCFRPGKNSHKHQRYSRAYIEFKRPEDVFEFAEFFDGHVFVNEKGTQFKSIVEYAPSQRVPKPSNKKDGREGTIYKDPDYLEFLKHIAKPAEHLPSAEIQLERKEAEQAGAAKEAPIVTPLMEYVRQKRAIGSGTQISSVVRKVRRRTGATSFSKRGSTSTKRVSEKKKYILKDAAKYTSRKDRSTFNLVPRREDQLASSSGKDTMGNEIGSVSGIPVIADSGRTKILLKREIPPAPEGMPPHQASIGSSPVSAAPKQNQRRDASGRFLRSILSHNEGRQREASAEVQSQQKILGPNSDIKRVSRPSNTRLGLNNEPNSMSSEGDRRRATVDKFTKKDVHGTTNVSEKQDKHTRNKDRPDRGVWTPLRRAESSHASDEHLSSSASQRPQLLSDSVEVPHGEVKADTSYGSRTGEVITSTGGRSLTHVDNGPHRHFGRRGTAPSTKDDGSLNISEGKSSKRGAAVHGVPEKQVWVQKSSSGS